MFSSNPMHSASSVPPGDYEFIGIATTSQEHLTRVAKVFRIVVVVVVAELSIFVIGSVERGISFEGFIQLAISLAVSRTRGFFLSNSFSPCDSFFPTQVPYCGYCGARNVNKDALMYFCGCNFLFALLTLIMCFLTWSSYVAIQQFCEECGDTSLLTENCYGEQRSNTYNSYCVDNGLEKYQNICIINTVISLPLTALYCFGFILGRNLWLHAEDIFISSANSEPNNADPEGGNNNLNSLTVSVATQPPEEKMALRSPSIQIDSVDNIVEMSTRPSSRQSSQSPKSRSPQSSSSALTK